MPGVACGDSLSVWITASDDDCTTEKELGEAAKTFPCTPTNMSASVECSPSSALMNWTVSQGAVFYIAMAQHTDGTVRSCHSMGSNCLIQGLNCGKTYTASVIATDMKCNSSQSQLVTIETGACPPTNVTTSLQCDGNMGTVSWTAVARADMYLATATGDDGHTHTCGSNSTDCSFTDLHCAETYAVTVVTIVRGCHSDPSPDVELRTGACPPTNVTTSLQCDGNMGTVSWTAVARADMYLATATGDDGHSHTCSSNSTDCSFTDLHCAETYAVTVVTIVRGCHSDPSPDVELRTGACPPTNVTTSLQCDGNMGTVSWTAVARADMYLATATGDDGHSHTCSSNSTDCSFTDLHCAETYAVTVVTIVRGCHSDPSPDVELRTGACPPTNVTTSLQCDGNMGTVSWTAVARADMYLATATGDDGHSHTCSSNSTDCSFTDLHCAETYAVTVVTIVRGCHSDPSPDVELRTGACPPTNVTTSLQCDGNMGTVSWTAVARADMYLATATGDDGHTHTCSSNSTDCSFTDLHCAETYAVTVVTIVRGCHSDPSPDVELRTALCPPIDLEGMVSCSTNILSLTWDASPVYGANYTLHSQKIGGANTTTSYPTSDSSIFITGLQCGERYKFQVVTSDGTCNSSLSRPLEMDTAPCHPTHLAAQVDCGTNRGNISWFESVGASYYIAEVTGGHGHVAYCTSNDTSCVVKLHCGRTYSATLVASTDSCNSTLHATIEFDSAPCLPENVVAELNCNSNVLSVQWQQTPGDADDTYTALAIGSDGYQASCNSTSTSCSISNLQCGQTYEVAVTSSSINCSIIAGSDYRVQSAPCKPQNTTVDLECSTTVATVIWDLTSTSQNYTVTATDMSGTNTSCNTNETSCSFSELSCGEMYTFSVMGHTNVCMSEVSSPMQMLTAPCVPTNIASSLDCGTGMAFITWNSAVGATAYTVQAEGNHGHKSSCSDTGTQCSLKNLACGQEYSVVVVALHTGCPGPGSQAVTFTTAPCSPQSVETQLDCTSGRLNVSWQPSVGATRYHATLQDGSNVMMCDTNTTSCVVPDLSCGNAYNVTVVAQGQSCNSSHSAANEISTAPCPPTSLSATVDCSTNIAMVTWDSQNAQGVAYSARASDVQGSSVECNTTDSNCALTRLQCGSEYNVTVTASKDNCSSVPSLTFTFTTAPCVPLLSDVQLLCSSDSASITWATAAGAELYEVTAEDGQGGSLQCNSSDVTSCQVSSLQCGQQYVFSVTASDRLCVSPPSAMIQSMTAPCPPQNIHTSVGCENRTACISWIHSQGALSYTARLHRADGEAASCSSNATGCDITSLPCGETYTVTVAAEGHTCNSSQSSESSIKTAPCVPSAPVANLSCSTNMAAMTWNSSLGADLYSVVANSSAGHSGNCQSAGLSCELTTLLCGQTYKVTVTAQDSTCTSASSQSVEVKTVPCVPTGVMTSSDCLSNAVTASWLASDGSEYYTATLEDGNGMSTTCKSVGKQCNVTGLQCGQVYHVTVAGSDDQCTSPQSVDTHTHSVPCLPSSIQAVMDCEAVSATVSWQPSTGALSYVTTVTAGLGHNASCATNHTNCEMSVLDCGEDYTVSVKALGKSCSSVAQMTGHLITEPCVPMYLSVSYSLSIAQLFWDTAKGATSYSAQAITDQGLTVSCHTNHTYCALPAMACGQIYNVTVSASNSACNNSVTTKPYTLMTEPCPPTNVQASMDCNTLTGSVSWEASDVAMGYAVVLGGEDGHSTDCLTTATSCDMGGLNCGTVYYVYVRALGVQFNSSVSSGVILSPAPCLPSSVQAQVDCGSDGAALLSWSYTDGANNYTLSANGVGGEVVSCTTQQNHCNVTGLSCGAHYNITLTATNQECQITVPINASFDTRPCAPQHVAVDLTCGTQTADLSWEERSEVELYVSSASRWSDGAVQHCNSTGSTCHFTDLTCGETYSFTVTASANGCHSPPSNTVQINTEPCQPTGVTSQLLCNSEQFLLSWHPASGAALYMVTATGNLGYVEAFNTTKTSLSSSLPCGQIYSVTLLGQDHRCDSQPSTPVTFKTAPCVPQAVETYVECGASIGSVSWMPSDGADTYTAIAIGRDAHTHPCVTNNTSCTWSNLHCGEEYTVHVTSGDDICTSSPGNSTIIQMAPCVPQDLVASLDCGLSMVYLNWNASEGAEKYLLAVYGTDGYFMERIVNTNLVQLPLLSCGKSYSMTVIAANQNCSSAPSGPADIQTWPCPPTAVSASLDCLSNIAMVTWEESNGTDFYTATLETAGGQSQTCMSPTSLCGVPSLDCGLSYSVSVTASNLQCNSTQSIGSSLQTGPCAPGNLQTSLQCSTNSTSVTWDRGSGALSYMVVGEATNSHITSCNSSATYCDLEGLQCGQMYNVSVHSMDGVCRSIQSVSSDVQTAPCPPQNVAAQVYCASGIMLVTWEPNMDARFFLVDAVTEGGSSHSCNTTDTQCSITSLPCGESFSVQVTAAGGGCHSMPSQALNVSSAPCMPTRVNGSQDCVTNSAWVSWAPALGVDRYMVTADGVGGYNSSCSTLGFDTTCKVPDLACGVRYNFSVTASNGHCDSPPSATFDLETAPCALASITAFAQCHNSSILVLWAPMGGSVGNSVYTATAEASDRSVLTCNSSASSCDLEGALCGLHYTVIVAASSDSCTSQRSPPYRISMEPCPPQGVVISSSCESHGAHVSWTASPVAETYLMIATGGNGDVRSCNTASNNCSLSALQCGQQYAVSVTASHENCSSTASQSVTFNTGPCQPDGLSVLVQCVNHSALLSWTARGGVVDYWGCAQAEDGIMLYCESTGTSCTIAGLECGAQYNFSVQASDGTCNSSFSEPLLAGAAPCPPEAMAVTIFPMQNQTQFLHASWTHVNCPNVQYLLEVTGSILGDSQSLFELSSYWTSSSFFELLLPCGSSYSATVRSRNFAGYSAPSAAITGITAPCPPPVVTYSGSNSSATISWNSSVYATMYMVYDISGVVRTQVCSTVELSCSLANLDYNNLEVTASNTAGESDPTREITVHHLRRRDLREEEMISETGLSMPEVRVTVETLNVLLVEWSPVKGAAYYTLVVREQSSRPRHASRSQILTVYGESSIVTDLNPSSTYCLSVSAQTEASRGPYSEPVCVETAVKM
uniref:Uncharacterized LOC115157442 n=1 Tax=Salmo trutta TaxID=8032 RepID=A0A674DRB0_SALTR